MLRAFAGPLALLLLLLAAATQASAAPASVDIVDFAFWPAEVRVAPGETVTWRFRGSAMHTVTSDSGQGDSFRSGDPRGLRPGRYIVRLQAEDDAGNRSAAKIVRVRIRLP